MAGILLTSGGTENNDANIVGSAYGVEITGGVGTLLNSGSIVASDLDGIGALLTDGGSVTNSAGGSISGATAVSLLDGGTVINTIGAAITSYFPSADSVAINILGAEGNVSNSGLIATRSTSSAFYAIFFGAGGIVENGASGVIETGATESAISIMGGSGQVTNAGTISAGVYAVSLASGGSLDNSGDIYGRVAVGGISASITNSGAIFAPGSVAGAGPAIGVSIGAGMVSNQAGGSIGGGGVNGVGVSVTGGGSVYNAGSISGAKAAIAFSGAGANTLTLDTGSVLNGAVLGSTAQGATNALVLMGAGMVNAAFVDFNTLTMQTSGRWTFSGVSTFGSTNVATGTLAISGVLTTSLTEAATVRIGLGGKLKLTGDSTLGGLTGGLGTLAVKRGLTTVADGAELSVANWLIAGATTGVTIDEALTYNGVFTAASGAVITVSGGPLTLSGTAALAGVEITGSQRVRDWAKTSVTGLHVTGAGGFANKSVLTQSGAVVLGDADGGVSGLYNSAGAIWNLVNDSGIALGASPLSQISNLGTFAKTGGTGVSLIAPGFSNSGNVLVSSGTLDFQAQVTGVGVDTVSGAATLELDAGVADTQTIAFQGSGGVLDLGSPTLFSARISGFDTVGANDALELLGKWSISGYSPTDASDGVLTVSNGSQTATLAFAGRYQPSLFAASTASGHTTITYV